MIIVPATLLILSLAVRHQTIGALCLLVPAVGQAHPFGARFAAHRMELLLDADEIEVRYVVDVPNAIVRSASRPTDPEPMEAMLGELTTGLVVEVNGMGVSTKTTQASRLRGDEETQLMQLVVTAPLDSEANKIRVSNGNLPETPAYFVNTVLVGPGVAVRDSSLMQMANGEVQRDHNGRWRIGDINRSVEVDFAIGEGWFDEAHRWLLHEPTGRLPLAAAVPKTTRQMLFCPVSTVGTMVGSLVVAALVALPVGATTKNAQTITLALAMAIAVLLSWLIPPPWWSHVEFVAGLAAAVLAAGLFSRPRSHWLWGVGLCACLFSTHHPAVTALTAGVAIVGICIGYLTQQRLGATWFTRFAAMVLLAAGGLMLCRGAGELFWT